MQSAMRVTRLDSSPSIPLLHSGDRLTQREFHRRYEAYPEDVKFELIGGIVYMASPLRRLHAIYHLKLGTLLSLYADATPGVEALDNATTILGEESEPQPDLALRILPEYGGQSFTDQKDYVNRAPELIAEVAHSSHAIDLHQKKDDYEKAGVVEYLVLSVDEKSFHWFHFKSKRKIQPDSKGIYRSRVFPGLWIDSRALLAREAARVNKVLQEGLASSAHAAFVRKLTKTGRKDSGS
jgi:Uma2 family endonuclease